MTTTLATKQNGAQLPALSGYPQEEIDLIKQTVAQGASDVELRFFLYNAARFGLDPLAKQIHFVKRQRDKPGTIQTAIDGYRLIADRTKKYAGSDDPVHGPEEELSWQTERASGKYRAPVTATVTVWKLVSGQRCPFTATARWSEYYPGDAQGFMWRKMPYLMLAKCAESLALRKAFPAELSGLYTHEEMNQATDEAGEVAEVIDVTPAPPRENPVAGYNIVTWEGLVPAQGEHEQFKPDSPPKPPQEDDVLPSAAALRARYDKARSVAIHQKKQAKLGAIWREQVQEGKGWDDLAPAAQVRLVSDYEAALEL